MLLASSNSLSICSILSTSSHSRWIHHGQRAHFRPPEGARDLRPYLRLCGAVRHPFSPGHGSRSAGLLGLAAPAPPSRQAHSRGTEKLLIPSIRFCPQKGLVHPGNVCSERSRNMYFRGSVGSEDLIDLPGKLLLRAFLCDLAPSFSTWRYRQSEGTLRLISCKLTNKPSVLAPELNRIVTPLVFLKGTPPWYRL
jgi:hypothetical protein